jgi:hypothetical protein
MLNFKNKFLFSNQNSLKSLYFIIICNLTHLQDGNTKVKFVLRLFKKIHVGSETGSGSTSNTVRIRMKPTHEP